MLGAAFRDVSGWEMPDFYEAPQAAAPSGELEAWWTGVEGWG